MALVLMCGLILIASCGREAPSYEPGTITVTSTDDDSTPIIGATIYMDGTDTEQVTPYSFTELPANRYEISVVLDGYFPDPTSTTVDLLPAQHAQRNFVLNSEAPTLLSVDSDPAGAAIWLDGADSGEVTPATITLDDDSEVALSLELDTYYSAPASLPVMITANETTVVTADEFSFRSKKTVMMEGFSNVDCNGCPDLAINVGDLMHQDGYGLDRVLYTKFSMSWPGPDPHYNYNTPENNDRMNYYISFLGTGIPMMTLDGDKASGSGANSTPTSGELATLVDTALLQEPGFLIDVVADFTSSTVPFTATVTAMDDVDLSNLTLYVALVQELVEYEEAPGNQGETEFHWLFRDRLDTLPSLSDMTAGQTMDYTGDLARSDWDLETLYVIAFAQDDTSKEIKQAGLTVMTSHAPASAFVDNSTTVRQNLGKVRP